MDLVRSVAAVIAGVWVALVVFDRPAAEAGPTVFSSEVVCADVSDFSPVQTAGHGNASLKLVGAGNPDLQVEFKVFDLPASSPVVCGLVCATADAGFRALTTDLVFDSFVPAIFPTCGSTNAAGKLAFFGRLPFVDAPPFNGGCLLPIPVLAVLDQASELQVVCAPGFGTFASGSGSGGDQ